VSRLTPFPYWGHSGFSAYRPRDVEEIDDYDPYIQPVAGSNRYATAVAASKLVTASVTSTYAVLCSGENWPDALGGSALAGALDGPVLLASRDRLPGDVARELQRLRVQNVKIIGGEAALSADVEAAVDRLSGVSVERISGRDRYDTAGAVAEATVDALGARGLGYDGAFYLATGESYPDALGAATVAAHAGRPILLSQPTTMPATTARTMRSIEATMAYIAGGTVAISRSVEASLTAFGVQETERIAGSDRYVTALRLAQHGAAEGLAWNDVALATGDGFADALAGAVTQARRGSPLVLTPSDRLCVAADWAVREHQDVVDRVTIYGGEAAVHPIVRRQIRWMMDEP
jgi:putative cell wall-binding protein